MCLASILDAHEITPNTKKSLDFLDFLRVASILSR